MCRTNVDVTGEADPFEDIINRLHHRKIELRVQWKGRIRIKSPLIHMTDYSDDLWIWNFVWVGWIRIQVNIVTNWIFTGKVFLSEALVDDSDCRCVLVV